MLYWKGFVVVVVCLFLKENIKKNFFLIVESALQHCVGLQTGI